MEDYDPASRHETSATSGSLVAESSSGVGAAQALPPASSLDSSVSAATVKQARWAGERRSLLIRKGRWPAAAVVAMCAVIGLSGCAATSSSAAATPPSATAAAVSAEARHGMPGSGGDLASGGGGSEAALDRPQGDHRARSPTCPRRASRCRHQRVRRSQSRRRPPLRTGAGRARRRRVPSSPANPLSFLGPSTIRRSRLRRSSCDRRPGHPRRLRRDR